MARSRRRAGPIIPITSVDVALSTYDETFLECRNLGHVWRVLGYFRAPTGNVVRHLRCQRCETIRVDAWAFNGDRLGARYHHADGYLITDVGAPIHAHDVRVEMIKRATIYESEADMLASITTPRPRRRAAG
jgi:hypothetical protein